MNDHDEDLSRYQGGVELEHFWYENDGLRLHAVAAGKGPLLVMLHGFPEFWYCWRHQFAPLARHYRVLAPDLRGFNSSESPKTTQGYAMPAVAGDILALIRATGEQQAFIVAHDWGGYVGWHAAHLGPQSIRGLITLGVPHPSAMGRSRENNPDQRAASAYVASLADEQAHKRLSPEEVLRHLPLDVGDEHLYCEAFTRSGMRGPLGYYRMLAASRHREGIDLPNTIHCPVLAIHARDDPYVLESSYLDNEQMTTANYRLEVVDGGGHFLPREKAQLVNQAILEQLQQWAPA